MSESFVEHKKCYDSCKPAEPNFLITGESELQGKSFIDTIYAEHKVPFNSSERKGFLPGVPVHVSIIDAIYSDSSARLNPYLYTIELKHGQFRWTVLKRYHHFLKLHTALFVSRTKKRQHQARLTSETDEKSRHESIPNRSNMFSSEKSHQEFSVFDVDEDGSVKAKFPKKPDVLLSRETSQIDDRKRQLENYLQSILRSETYRKSKDLLEFLEVSEYSFIKGSIKCKEGLVKKRTGDDTSRGFHQQLVRFLQYIVCQSCGFRWRKIWLVICETCILGVNPQSGEIRTVLLFDKDFQISSGVGAMGVKNSVLLINRSRHFWVKTKTSRKTKDWQEEIEKILIGSPAAGFTTKNRHDSFAPVRFNQNGQWFVDGESHMSAVADAIELAKEEIFITDWWLSPEIHLKRGVGCNDSYRLDALLRKKSAEGVQIFILLYKEFQLALSLNSLYTKRTLMSKGGKNIKVLRHPDRVSGDVNDFLWAHHEKIVVVDQCIAFVGGIDLCYGRWDTNKHPLTDVDVVDQSVGGNKPLPVQPPSNSTRSKPRFNERGMHLAFVLKAAHEVTTAPIRALDYADNINDDSDVNLTNEGEHKRMRIRIRRVLQRAKSRLHQQKDNDSEIGTEESDCESNDGDQVDGENADETDTDKRKSRRRTLRRAIHRMRSKKKCSSSSATSPKSSTLSSDWSGVIPDTSSPNGNNPDDSSDQSPKALPSSNLWKGKDYVNFIVKDIARPDLPEADNVDRRTTPRMPWHDIAVMVTGEAARDVARHFIQRWNTVKTEKAKFYPKYPYLVPKCYSSVKDDRMEIETYFARTNYPNYKVNCQVLRSFFTWGSDLETGEASIHSAMVDVIKSAKHYIYIENQFFITMVQPNCNDREVKNEIGNAIFERILEAHKSNTDFKVYIMLPLLPAFEGQIGSNSTGSALRVILHYNYASICRGETSLFRQLELKGITPMKYVTFCSLRTWDELLNTPVTELVYIHSKLMICDDRIVICGSANINDRSLLGSRDSEVCLLMEDTEFTPAVFNGQKVESGRFAGSLRRHLMREHLGILGEANGDEVVEDPVSDSFYKDVWIKRAAINTKIFEDVFLSVPNDIVTNLEDCKKYEERTPPAEIDRFVAIKTLKKVKGSLVLLPLHFLESEDLLPSRFAMEGMVPSITWT